MYRDRREPLCFRNVSNIKPIFQRRNDRETRKRVAELNDKGKVQALLLEPCFRRCHDVNVDLRNQWDVDIMLSEAPSMTACGQIETDRTFIRIPHTENLFIIYNRFQEERRLKM